MGSRETRKSAESATYEPTTLGEVRRDRANNKSPITAVVSDLNLLSRDFASHRRSNEAMTFEELTSSHHTRYTPSLEQNHSPISSTSTSPPAPAQSTSPLPLGNSLSVSHGCHASSSPSRSIHENDPFLLLKENTPSKKSKSKSNSANLMTTNGWSKEHSPTTMGKKAAFNLGIDYPNEPSHPVTPNPNSQATSPMPIGNEPLAQLLITLKEQNKSLIREIEDLRIKLEDAEGDLKLVRCQMRSMSKHMDSVVIESNRDRMVDESILGELEFYKEKVMLLERDIQSLLDEKEELVMSRDDLTLKNDRLNEHLISLMRNLSGQTDNYAEASSLSYDVDALYLENRYLKEKVKNEEEEKRLLLDRLAKYKDLMEQHQRGDTLSKKKYFANNSTNDTNDPSLTTLQLPGGHVVSARDVERLINSDSIHSMEVNKSNQMYLWNLLVAMFEGLQTKNMNLVHSRKTNRLLGKRVEELESHFHTFEMEGRFPKVRSGKSPLKMSGVESGSARSTPTSINMTRHEDLVTLDPLDTDGNISTPMTKETSEEENDELSSTGISTPSTARHSMSIEQHLQALQNDALSDSVPLHLKLDVNSVHLHHGRASSNHHYEFNRDFDSHKSPNSTLFN